LIIPQATYKNIETDEPRHDGDAEDRKGWKKKKRKKNIMAQGILYVMCMQPRVKTNQMR
jgi:hypothetical protein